jgi:hypothetical protein
MNAIIERALRLGPRKVLAFTLIELLAIVALGALLVVVVVTPVNRPRTSRGMRSIACLNNCKQLATGYIMYASDYHDTALASAPNTNGVPLWAPGNVATLPDAVDDSLLKNSPTYRYLSSTRVFHCPADESGFLYQGQRTLRNRSLFAKRVHGARFKPSYGQPPGGDRVHPSNSPDEQPW